MKKNGILKIIMICIFTFIGISDVAASSVSLKASSSSITRGNTVTITTTINADSGIYTIEGSMSCKGAGVSGGQDLTYSDLDTKSKSKSFTYTIKPTSSGTVTCSTSNVMLRELSQESNYSLGNKTITIQVKDPVVTPSKEYSSNNNLESLSVEGFELDKKFDKDTLEYNVEVPNDTEKVNIKASAVDKNATIKGTGEISVSEGTNKVEIKVTAENGNVKTYTINITVKELDPIEVKIDGKDYTIIRKEGIIDPPENFEKTTVKIGDEDVLAYKNDKVGYTLVALKDENGDIKYYIYDDGEYSEFNILTARGFSVIVLDYPKSKVIEGYIINEFEVDNNKYKGYQSKKGSNFYLIYGKNLEDGKEYLYQYDASEGTLQKYNEDIIDLVDKYKEEKDKYKLYLIIVASVFGVAVVATITTLIIKNKKGRKKTKVKLNQINSDINF